MYEDDALEIGYQINLWPHVRPDLKVGQIATNTHTLFAGTCEVKIRFKGKGGHAAFHMKLMTPWWRLVTL